MEARLDAIETALVARPTAEQIRLEMDRHFNTIIAVMKEQRGEKKESRFNFREAQYHKPQKWSGRKDKIDFIEFSNSPKN